MATHRRGRAARHSRRPRSCTARAYLVRAPVASRTGGHRKSRALVVEAPARGGYATPVDGPPRDRPYFLWDVDVTEAELRARLRHPDPAIRAQWQGCLLREARFDEVWSYLTLDEVLRDWPLIQRHLGRRRDFWVWLLDGWRKDGLLPAA